MPPFDKHPAFIIRSEDPFNGGPPLPLLGANQVTPNDLFFVRNHAPVPEIDPADYRLRVGGMVSQPLRLSLDDLRRMPARTLLATLQCAGNRRTELEAVAHIPGELIWDAEAISTATWTGVALRDVLRAAGADETARHVAFLGLDQVEKDGARFGLGGSIPMAYALNPNVLLAYEMNGQPLPPTHGYPLRVVAPGYIGARSVKWLGEINVQMEPSDNYYQAHAYKLFPPGVNEHNVDWETGMMLGEMSVGAVICGPAAGDRLPLGSVRVSGFAVAGGGRSIERVDISADGGTTWQTAALLSQPEGQETPYAWRFWETRIDVQPGEHEIVARAWDSAANTQPEDVAKIWNFKGYMNNAWHRVRVVVKA